MTKMHLNWEGSESLSLILCLFLLVTLEWGVFISRSHLMWFFISVFFVVFFFLEFFFFFLEFFFFFFWSRLTTCSTCSFLFLFVCFYLITMSTAVAPVEKELTEEERFAQGNYFFSSSLLFSSLLVSSSFLPFFSSSFLPFLSSFFQKVMMMKI